MDSSSSPHDLNLASGRETGMERGLGVGGGVLSEEIRFRKERRDRPSVWCSFIVLRTIHRG